MEKCVLSQQQEGRAPEMRFPMEELRAENLSLPSQPGGKAVQNGPAVYSSTPSAPRHCYPGEDARDGDAEEVDGEPTPTQGN